MLIEFEDEFHNHVAADSKDLIPTAAYAKVPVVVNCAGIIGTVISEKEAQRLASIHPGWSWGVLLQARTPKL